MNKHLGSNERYQIQFGLAQGLPVSAIAQGIGYSKSTIYREITNNGGGAGYDAKFAQQRASRRAARSRNARTIAAKTWYAVDHYVLLAYSPEQIANMLPISHETIYRHVYRDKGVSTSGQHILNHEHKQVIGSLTPMPSSGRFTPAAYSQVLNANRATW